MRSPLVLTVCFFVGCGASSAPAPRANTPSAGPVEVAEATETSEPDAEVPCTTWDPEADPTIAPADVAAPPETARRGAMGLRFCILRPGEGETRPSRTDHVRVHYTGWTTDGEMFDSSHTRGEPLSIPVDGVIRGWIESLTHMTVGQVRRVWIPEDLAYRGEAERPAGMLVFDIELVAID